MDNMFASTLERNEKNSMSNKKVQRPIDKVSYNIDSFLCNYRQRIHFSIPAPGNAVLLLTYLRFIMDKEIHTELFLVRTFDNRHLRRINM